MDRDSTVQWDRQVAHHNVRKTEYVAQPHRHAQPPWGDPVFGVSWQPPQAIPDHAPTNPPPFDSPLHRQDPWKWSVSATNRASDPWIFLYLRQYAPTPNLATFESPVMYL